LEAISSLNGANRPNRPHLLEAISSLNGANRPNRPHLSEAISSLNGARSPSGSRVPGMAGPREICWGG